MNLVPAIIQMESEKKRFENIRDERFRDLRQAFWTFSKYCKPCSCNSEKSPDFILNHLFDEPSLFCGACKGVGYLPIEGKINMIPGMELIIAEIKENNKKYQTDILDLEAGLKVIREMNTTCEKCKGEGKVLLPRPNVYCDKEYGVCQDCKGSGKKLNK